MRITLATRPATLLDRCELDAIWLDARNHTIAREGSTLRLQPMKWRVAAGIIGAAPCLVRIPDIIEALWGDDPEGGPLWAELTVRTHLTRVRRLLPRVGVQIVTNGWSGYSAWFEPSAEALAA